jgi:hypothetical protein
MLAEGGEAIADLTVLRNQPALFGRWPRLATAWRVLNGIDAAALARIRVARARARELSWMQAAETGRLLSSTVGGFAIPGSCSTWTPRSCSATRRRNRLPRPVGRRGATELVFGKGSQDSQGIRIVSRAKLSHAPEQKADGILCVHRGPMCKASSRGFAVWSLLTICGAHA